MMPAGNQAAAPPPHPALQERQNQTRQLVAFFLLALATVVLHAIIAELIFAVEPNPAERLRPLANWLSSGIQPHQTTTSKSKSDKKQLDNQMMVNVGDFYFQVLHPKPIAYTYVARPSRDIGLPFNTTIESYLVLASPIDACRALHSDSDESMMRYLGSVLLIRRGQCAFVEKVLAAQRVGAVAALIYDNRKETDVLIEMLHGGEVASDASIPAAFISAEDGRHLQEAIERTREQSALVRLPVNYTAEVPLHRRNLAPWNLW